MAVKPTTAADVKEYFLTTNREVMEYALTGEAIGA